MKNPAKILTVIGLLIFILTSCNNSGSNKTTEKDLELQKKELDLKQKELEHKKKLAMDSVQNANQKKTTVTIPKQTTQQKTKNTTSSSQSSTTVSLSPLMRSNLTFNLPTTSGRLISSMGKYSKIEYEDDDDPSGWGNRYIWKFSSGLILTGQSDGGGKTPNNSDEVRAIFLEASNKNPIDNLVYGLALNKTTKSDCQQLFGSKFQTTVWVNDTYKVYKDNLYTYLTFNSNGTLTKVQQVTFDLENAD
jgi:hypothetical protein